MYEVTSLLLSPHSELSGILGQVLYGECSMGVQLVLACHQGHVGREVRVFLLDDRRNGGLVDVVIVFSSLFLSQDIVQNISVWGYECGGDSPAGNAERKYSRHPRGHLWKL